MGCFQALTRLRHPRRRLARRTGSRTARRSAHRAPAAASWVPRSTMRPSSTTRIVSAARTVDSRWAMTIEVRPGQRLAERLLHRGLRLGVQRRGGLVEHHDAGPAEQQARDGQPLALPAGEPVAALPHHGVEAVGHLGDDVGQPGAFQRLATTRRRSRRARPAADSTRSTRGTGDRPGSPCRRSP